MAEKIEFKDGVANFLEGLDSFKHSYWLQRR